MNCSSLDKLVLYLDYHIFFSLLSDSKYNLNGIIQQDLELYSNQTHKYLIKLSCKIQLQ